jgi:hypothetical protein
MYQVSAKIAAFFHSDIPPELWHYTSLAALEGILSSGKIWATEARFTTDKEEYIYAQQVAVDLVESLKPLQDSIRQYGLEALANVFKQHGIRQYGLGQYGLEALAKLLNIAGKTGVLSSGFADVFIASFTSAKDLESQWKNYGNDSAGVSIAFDLRHNVRPAYDSDTSVSLAPCIYGRPKQEELLREAFSQFREPFDAIERSWPIIQRIFPTVGGVSKSEINQTLTNANKLLSRHLLVLSGHYKNPDYLKEYEWRIVLPRSKMKGHLVYPIKFRTADRHGTPTNVPYIEIGYPTPEPNRVPISEVMAGGHCDVAKVEAILTQHGYNVPVTRSQLPT